MKTQSSLFPDHVPDSHFDYDDEFTGDDWESPPKIAEKIASLLLPSDKYVVEPFAGSGQIARLLPDDSEAIELKPDRVRLGREKAPHCTWLHQDFFSFAHSVSKRKNPEKPQVFVTNPPFSLGFEAVEACLKCLDPQYEYARLLFLLPVDYFQAKGVNQKFAQLGAHIHRVYQFVGRISYLESGVAKSGRMRNDCVFDIRPGKHQGGVVFL